MILIPFREFLNPAIKAIWDIKCISELVHIRVEREIVEHAKHVESVISKRVLEQFEREKGVQGILGLEIFNEVLLELKIPNLYAYPLLGAEYEKARPYRMIEGKRFDFYVPKLPKNKRFISIKTTPEGARNIRFIINKDGWEDERHDIAVAVKIDSFRKARLCGWLYAKEVEELPICKPQMDSRCRKVCYWTYLDPERVKQNVDREKAFDASPKLRALNSMVPLMKELMQISIDPKIRENERVVFQRAFS